MNRALIAASLGATLLSAGLGACSSEYRRQRIQSERTWGSERGCLPCHLDVAPIEDDNRHRVSNHNYRCDTCHNGDASSHTKTRAHRDLIASPQDPASIKFTCQKCHNETLSSDVPYDAEFVAHLHTRHQHVAP